MLAGARRRGVDGGQAVPVVLVVVAGVVSLGLGVVQFGARQVDAARAAAAADASALAGVHHGRSVAEAIAEANGARLVDWRVDHVDPLDGSALTVTVRVVLDSAEAAARASRAP